MGYDEVQRFRKNGAPVCSELTGSKTAERCRCAVEMGFRKTSSSDEHGKATKINPAHTISLRQTECRKTGETITAAVYEYLVDNDGEWGELRFDFENGTAEIVKLADWDTVKSNVFAKMAIRYIQGLPEARLLKSVVVPFWKGRA